MVDYNEDWLQRIVAVHWRPARALTGVVFIFGEYQGNRVHYIRFRNASDRMPTISETALPERAVDDDFNFLTTGSSFSMVGDDKKAPAFLLCGVRRYRTDTAQSASVVYRSDDGLSWYLVREQATSNAFGGIEHVIQANALVWNPAAKQFFFDQNIFTNTADGEAHAFDQIFSSANGFSWAMDSNAETDRSTTYTSSFSEVRCAHIDCIDQYGHHTPDGVSWQDNVNKIVARPLSPPVVIYGVGGMFQTSDNNIVQIVDAHIGITRTVAIPGLATVNCAAGNSGLLMVGGATSLEDNPPGGVAYSHDGGETWTFLLETAQSVVTVVSAMMA